MPNINERVTEVNRAALIPDDQMLVSVEELKSKGLSMYKINQLVEQGSLVKLNRKYYENAGYIGDVSDFYYAYAYVPAGVICLLSAAVYYDLTTYVPEAIDIAIRRKARVSTMPEWPEISLHYYTDDRFSLGIQTIDEGKNHFRIFDLEKTVVDIVYYRKQIGAEETKEILTKYLQRKDRNLNRLMRYAEAMKCGDTLRTYLEVLI